MTRSEIPYATEQGIFGGLTRNSLELSGNLMEGWKGRKRPFLIHLLRGLGRDLFSPRFL
jgi:hypothetical protein